MNIIAELLIDIAGGVARAIAAAILGFLIHKGIIDAGKAGHFTTGLTSLLTSAIGGIGLTVGWSAWSKVRAWYRVKVALALPAGSTVQKLATAIDTVDAQTASVIAVGSSPDSRVTLPAHLLKAPRPEIR